MVELLITMVVLGLLLTVAVPSFQDFLLRNQLQNAVEKVYSDLRFARSEAIKRNTDVAVSFSSGANWCYGLNDGAACACGTTDDCQLAGITTVVSSADYGNVSLANTFTSNSTLFNSNRGTAGAGSVTLSLSGLTAVISVNAVGQTGICSNDLSGYSACP